VGVDHTPTNTDPAPTVVLFSVHDETTKMRAPSQGSNEGAAGHLGGDGGNRTRVRKFQSQNIYKHSRPIGFRLTVASRRAVHQVSHQSPRAPLSRVEWRPARHLDSLSPGLTPVKGGVRGRALLGEPSSSCGCFRQRGVEPRIQCVWHLCVALILRGRRLSACSSEPTTSVETDHPHVCKYSTVR